MHTNTVVYICLICLFTYLEKLVQFQLQLLCQIICCDLVNEISGNVMQNFNGFEPIFMFL
jgi:hypothetical protein